jgi:signal transduction histidine kinase
MDTERAALQMQNDRAARALSDSLHQIKNPLQAMRTYGKLLQRRIADLGLLSNEGMTPQLLEMAEHLLVQSDRLADRLKPVDTIVDSLSERTPFVLNPAAPTKTQDSLVSLATPLVPWESEILEFARESKTSGELVIFMPTKKVAASGSNGPSNSTTSFSGNGSDVSTYTEDDGAGEMPSSLFSEMDLEMSFLSDVLDPVLAAFRAIAEDRGIMLSYDDTEDLPGVTICPQALQEALINVIDNAFTYVFLPKPGSRFGPNPSAEVRIRLVQNSKGSDAGVTILVEDNGPGIPAEIRDQIFDRGVRSDSTRSIEGSGIGLDIAKTLVRRMGGILRVAKNDAFPNSLDGTVMELILFRNPKV